MSKYIVLVMMAVVFAMFWKGVEVLGPSNTNKDILYEGPKKTVEQRWQDAYDWMKDNVKINPNNFFKRELDILPPHFVNTVVKAHEADIENMRKWIYENCSGRYSITKDIIYDGDTSRSITVLGFENPGDLTLFALSGKAQINQN